MTRPIPCRLRAAASCLLAFCALVGPTTNHPPDQITPPAPRTTKFPARTALPHRAGEQSASPSLPPHTEPVPSLLPFVVHARRLLATRGEPKASGESRTRGAKDDSDEESYEAKPGDVRRRYERSSSPPDSTRHAEPKRGGVNNPAAHVQSKVAEPDATTHWKHVDEPDATTHWKHVDEPDATTNWTEMFSEALGSSAPSAISHYCAPEVREVLRDSDFRSSLRERNGIFRRDSLNAHQNCIFPEFGKFRPLL
jgi:hypothetical protein